MRVGWVFAVMLEACTSVSPAGNTSGSPDGPQGPLADYASGTRLRAMVWQSPDGAKIWRRWYDSQLKAPCTFVDAEDGKTRCLPAENFLYLFADEQCTVPLFVWDPTLCTKVAPKFVFLNTKCYAESIYEVGPKTTTPTVYQWQQGC